MLLDLTPAVLLLLVLGLGLWDSETSKRKLENIYQKT